MSLADIRREYGLGGLRRSDLAPDPIAQFKKWFDDLSGARTGARRLKFFVRLYKRLLALSGAEQGDLNAMTLATVDSQGRPSARIVLLKGVDERGFVFHTNYHSRKGRELAANPEAALVFYWPELERQVSVGGWVSFLPAGESDAYFESRPRGSRIGAWSSEQSEVIADRAALEARWREFEKRYPDNQIPRPPHWGGYLLAPAWAEFWQGRPNRLHDRFRYTRQPDNTWRIERLAP